MLATNLVCLSAQLSLTGDKLYLDKRFAEAESLRRKSENLAEDKKK